MWPQGSEISKHYSSHTVHKQWLGSRKGLFTKRYTSRPSNLDPVTLATQIRDIFVLSVFKVNFGSFVALVTKWHVTQKQLAKRFEKWWVTLVTHIWGTFDHMVSNVIACHSVQLSWNDLYVKNGCLQSKTECCNYYTYRCCQACPCISCWILIFVFVFVKLGPYGDEKQFLNQYNETVMEFCTCIPSQKLLLLNIWNFDYHKNTEYLEIEIGDLVPWGRGLSKRHCTYSHDCC